MKIPIMIATSVMIFALAACCSSIRTAQNSSVDDSETQASRINSCVRGGLPMEVQFALPDNPGKLGDDFDMGAINSIALKVDSRVSRLMSESLLKVWKRAAPHEVKWTNNFVLKVENEFNFEFAEQAPQALQLKFCGDKNQVGNEILIALGEYFYRTIQRPVRAAPPKWLKKFGISGPSNGRRIVTLAVALHLAKIEFDPQSIINAFNLN